MDVVVKRERESYCAEESDGCCGAFDAGEQNPAT